jgi:signal transduction histidine kinase
MERSHLIERLRQHRTLGSAPVAELEWLASNGRVQRFGVGEVIAAHTRPMEHLFVVLEGRFSIWVERAGARRKVLEWRSGDVSGVLPYSRMTAPPGDTVIDEPTEVLGIHRDQFRELTRECPHVTATLVHVMLDRARLFTSTDLHDDKMVSLGKLAAGLAHELNNPASATARSAKLLQEALVESEGAARALGAANLSAEQMAAVERARDACLSEPAGTVRSPIERADREDAMAYWLEEHDLDASHAPSLADAAPTMKMLDELARLLPGQALDAALRWIAAGHATRALASDIEKASSRIYHLVSAVKGFTHMDRAAAPEPVDLAQGITDTLAVLGAKAREKAASVRMEFDPHLVRVRGYPGELNQVWANVIDNALDAVSDAGRGHVSVSAMVDGPTVIVSVVDDGPGIPDDIKHRIFDPFFTTKGVGKGTGLGLDIARRLVRRHEGDIEVESRPGRTEFRVRLPIDLPTRAKDAPERSEQPTANT